MTTKKKTAPAPAFTIGDDEQYRSPDFTARIVGISYEIYVPKSMASIALARSIKTDKKGKVRAEDRDQALEAVMDWVRQAFDQEDAERIDGRLRDPKDKLDLEHMTEFMEKVNEHQTQESENPTT